MCAHCAAEVENWTMTSNMARTANRRRESFQWTQAEEEGVDTADKGQGRQKQTEISTGGINNNVM